MKKCCGKKPVLKAYDIPAREETDGYYGHKAQKAYWYECTSCGMANAYSYNSAKEAEENWDKGLVGRPAN